MTDSDIILFDKEEGITSFSSLYSIKRNYPRKTKIGHAGTLDKFASGLMIVLVGSATKLNPVFSSFDKSYIATIKFGEETDTLDPEGRIIKTSSLPAEDEVDTALKKIRGESMQTPPVYSAVHVDGKRAYREARKNHEIEMPQRRICVYDAEIKGHISEALPGISQPPSAKLRDLRSSEGRVSVHIPLRISVNSI